MKTAPLQSTGTKDLVYINTLVFGKKLEILKQNKKHLKVDDPKKINNRIEVASIFSLMCSLRLWKNFHSTQCYVLYDVNVESIIAFFLLYVIVFFSSLMPIEKMGDVENSEIPCTPWTTRMPKYAQPNLNYIGKTKRIELYLRLYFST